MFKLLGWGALIFCCWSVFLSLYVYYIYTHPQRYVSAVTPKDYGLKYETVSFPTSDGLELKGWFIPSPNKDAPAIIGCHGYPFDKGNILDLASFLYPDYNLFLFDFRGMGESQGRFTTVGYYEIRDLNAAVDYLKGRGFKEIGAIGFSLGAAVIILANNPDIKAVVSDSSFSDIDSVINIVFKRLGPLKWPLVRLVKLWAKVFLKIDTDKISPLNAIEGLTCPVLFIHCSLDTEIPPGHSEQLYKAARDAELWIVPNADHGQGYYINPEEYTRKVKGFFTRFLGLNNKIH